MSTAEIEETKSSLKAWIDQLSDPSMLSMLDGLRALKPDKYSWDDLSDYAKEQINDGLDDVKHGRVLTSDEFWNQLKNG
jgi:hypothetical protein